MAGADQDRFAERALQLNLAALFLVGAALLVLWLITTPTGVTDLGLWTWPGWTVIGVVLTFLTVLAALVALRYARDSARAARDTVQPLQTMATDLAAAAETMKANLEVAERGRREDRLIHRLEQYERVLAAVLKMQRAADRQAMYERVEEMQEAQGMLRAALAPLPPGELPTCRTASVAPLSYGVPQGGITNARLQVEQAVADTHQELDDLLKSATL